jgi:hypothetical protein
MVYKACILLYYLYVYCIHMYSVYTVSVQLYHTPVYSSTKTYVYRGVYTVYTACIQCIHLYIQCIHLYGTPVSTVYTVSVPRPITSTLPKLRCEPSNLASSANAHFALRLYHEHLEVFKIYLHTHT